MKENAQEMLSFRSRRFIQHSK